VAVDGLVAAEQHVAVPLADEHAAGGAGLVPGIVVHGAPAGGGPADDLDGAFVRIRDEPAVACERLRGGRHDGHGKPAQARRKVRVEIVEGRQVLLPGRFFRLPR
jgi:hypothetical protein